MAFLGTLPAQPSGVDSQCLLFVDFDFIWTLEVVREQDKSVPILNVISLQRGQWELEPAGIRLVRGKKEFQVTDFSVDSGDPANPLITKYLGIRGPDSVGVDLVGDFGEVDALSEVAIELGKDRFILDALDCKNYDTMLDKLGRLQLGGGNQVNDFEALGIQLFGRREGR